MSAHNDLATDPVILAELLLVRRATSYVARKVNELRDDELQEPSRLAGWSRAHIIAHLGYNARGICRLVSWANTGVESAMYPVGDYREREIEFGATLQPHALRHLFDHAAVSLNVEWRDTTDAAWQARVRTSTGREVPLTETPWMRLRELWLHAIDLDNGARWEDIPADLVQRLTDDIVGLWRSRGLDTGFELYDEASAVVASSVASPESIANLSMNQARVRVTGARPLLLAWASGRANAAERSQISASRLRADGTCESEEIPAAPRWI